MFKKLATNFFVDFDRSIIENLPDLKHQYGQPYPVSEEIHWMSYEASENEAKIPNSDISFSTHTYKFMPEFTENVIEKFKETFGTEISWDKERIRILRTKGYIYPHVDEVRNSCINIGLFNSNLAITHFGKTNNISDFEEPLNTESYICQDGEAYLLNVQNLHAIYPTKESNEFRYLITYSFIADYNTLLKYIKQS